MPVCVVILPEQLATYNLPHRPANMLKYKKPNNWFLILQSHAMQVRIIKHFVFNLFRLFYFKRLIFPLTGSTIMCITSLFYLGDITTIMLQQAADTEYVSICIHSFPRFPMNKERNTRDLTQSTVQHSKVQMNYKLSLSQSFFHKLFLTP